MAIININPDYNKIQDGWGFVLIDKSRTKFSIKYKRKDMHIPDSSALDFLDDNRIIIDLDDESLRPGKDAEEEKVPGIISPEDFANSELEEDKKAKEEVEKLKEEIKNNKLKKELKDLNKEDQVKKLLKFGLTKKEIRELNLESERIEKIMELMS